MGRQFLSVSELFTSLHMRVIKPCLCEGGKIPSPSQRFISVTNDLPMYLKANI